MGKRAVILVGMAAAGVWAIAVVLFGLMIAPEMQLSLSEAMAAALVPVGIILLLLIARLAARRFFDDTIIDGQEFSAGGAADIDQRVLSNTVEQAVLAICLWPVIGHVIDTAVVFALGLSLGFTRALFWWGYRRSAPLRGFGFAAGFYPTVLAFVLALGIAIFG